MGFTGGVAAQQITADIWRIQSRGNAYTASSTVQDYVLLKAAETTQAAGGAYFQIVSAGDASRASTFVSPGTSTTTVVGNQAFTTTSPGSVDTVMAPTAATPGVPPLRSFNLQALAFNARVDPNP